MKKIKLTESQYNKLMLNEGSYDQIVGLMGSKLKSGAKTLSSTDLSSIADSIYDAIKGVGTDEDAIKAGFSKCVNLHDVQALARTFQKNTGESIVSWLDGDIDSENDWNVYVLRPIRNAYNTSKQQGHFEAVKVSKVEEAIIAKFPCLKDTPGYKFYKEDAGRGILYFTADGGNYYGIKPDGTLYLYSRDENKYVAFPEKTKCVGAQYTSIDELNLHNIAEYGDTHEYGSEIEAAGLNLNPGGVTPEKKEDPVKKDVEVKKDDEVKTDASGGQEKQPVQSTTRLMTGTDVSEIQKMLHDAGLGDVVVSIDGKVGKNTLAGIKEFLLGANRKKIEAIAKLEPTGIEKITTNVTSPELRVAEYGSTLNESQKRFKRLIR